MKRNPANSWLLAGCLLLLSAARACAETVDDVGLWTALFAQGNIDTQACDDDKLKWWFDGHLRFLDDADGFNQSIVRPGLGWTLDDGSTLWAGYAWVHNSPISGSEFDEQRIWQQWTWSTDLGEWKFGSRSRFEQRFLETGDDVGLRYRQFLRLDRTLPSQPQLMLVGWDELFFHCNDTDWGARSGFDQNRAFVGIGYKPSSNCGWRMEIGYLNQFLDLRSGSDRVNHILAINFFLSP